MKIQEGTLLLSATDLAQHLGCQHATQLDRRAAEGQIEAPHWTDPILELLKELGLKHETAFAAALRNSGRTVVELDWSTTPARVAQLMSEGTDVLAQAPLSDGRFRGIADFLVRVEQPSALGEHSYEVLDTKLAQDTRAGTLLQLGLYSELVGAIQGRTPEKMHVIKPGAGFPRESFRVADFAAYFRQIKTRLADVTTNEGDTASYPTPVPQCNTCRWWQTCDTRRRDDDHLCLVAGMTTLHAEELQHEGITTLTALAELDQHPIDRPRRGHRDAFDRLRRQARIQLEGRRADAPKFELLPMELGRGLQRLPEPSVGDVFFDLESARFFGDGGLEYLFGWCTATPDGGWDYQHIWARDRHEERTAFVTFLDVVMRQWQRHPGMHVYHFAPYEPAALKRMLGRHATREAEVDRLLRGGRFIDLHAVARQGVRASVEQYSLKELEVFAGFERRVDLREASRARRRIERALESDDDSTLLSTDRTTVEGYNREDCEGTAALRDWLEECRSTWLRRMVLVPRPALEGGAAPEQVEARDAAAQAVYDSLLASLPPDRSGWGPTEQSTWLLAEMLDYHRREMNCAYWEFFRIHELDEWQLLDERNAVGGLQLVGMVGGDSKRPVHRYAYPEQETTLQVDDTVHEVGVTEKDLGSVVGLDSAQRTIDIQKRGRTAEAHPAAIASTEIIHPWVKAESLLTVARTVIENGIDGDGPYRAARDLLLGMSPRRAHPEPTVRRDAEDTLTAAIRVAVDLQCGVLAIQGPPGTGKTYTGAHMIARLAALGHRIGVTAVSHKVIRNLLDKVVRVAGEQGIPLRAAHKIASRDAPRAGAVLELDGNEEALDAVANRHVVGGTSWLWSRDDAAERLDYLFVDEAGQMALADTVAVARATKNLVLLGDPQQLEQPQMGAHPDGTDASALDHLLAGQPTMPPAAGLFLDTTWRLPPRLCAFTSEAYYESRLHAQRGTERQQLSGPTRFAHRCLVLETVTHSGNQCSAPEEVAAIDAIIAELLQPGVMWADRLGTERRLLAQDILVVAPYNAQVAAIRRARPELRIGTVDRFQGQEAPVVIYSMTSSSAGEAPRGMEFLFDPHRFNVATSRARCTVIVVASPELFAAECRTPAQMRAANGPSRFRELVEEELAIADVTEPAPEPGSGMLFA